MAKRPTWFFAPAGGLMSLGCYLLTESWTGPVCWGLGMGWAVFLDWYIDG